VNVHHSIYRHLPPQGLYFEALVEEAFTQIKKPFTVIEAGGRNQPRHDLLVENSRLSLKTETGLGTDPARISITKLCTTEREPWNSETLKHRVLQHLERYDRILMLRAIWRGEIIRYQLVEIPVRLLKLIESAALAAVGRRAGRQSLGGDVFRGDELLFHVHFDGSDGKCQVRNLRVTACDLLVEWELRIRA
jgi:type II restriction enzyme